MRVVPSGADDVTDAIANALSISFEDAERIKNQIGLQNVTGDERLEKAEEVIRETTAQLIVGIRNTLNLYDVDHAGGTISGVVLTGTGARFDRTAAGIGQFHQQSGADRRPLHPFPAFQRSGTAEHHGARDRFGRSAWTGNRKEAEVNGR